MWHHLVPEVFDEVDRRAQPGGSHHHVRTRIGHLAVSGKSAQASSVKDAMSTAHASFRVCAIAMKNQQVDKSQLLDNVQIVPDGVGELVATQHAGWGYIKIGH
jgi:intracellular sulfur oxidation DsrE/DsrF family protein